MTRHLPRAGRLVGVLATVGLLLTGAGCTGSGSAPTPEPTPSTPSGSPSWASPPVDGSERSPLGAHWDPSRTELFEAYLSTVPSTYTYYELTWCKVAKSPDAVNWAPVDKAVDFGNRMRIETMLKIRVGSCWATEKDAEIVRGGANKTESNMPKDLSAYTAFVTAVVQRYGPRGVREFAIENEVNSPSYWGGTPAEFATLATAAAAAIRAADPAAKVVDPGLSSTSYGYGIAQALLDSGSPQPAVDAWNTYYERRSGTRGSQLVQVTGVDELRGQLESDQGRRNLTYLSLVADLARRGVVDVRQIHFYEAPQAIPSLMRFLQQSTPGTIPIEAWEAGLFKEGGGDQVESPEQAADMVQSIIGLLAGGAGKVIWLPLAGQEDNRRGEEVRGGLLSPTGEVRRMGRIMTSLVAASTGAEVRQLRTATPSGAGFVRGDESTLVVWSEPHSTSLALGSTAKITDLYSGQTREDNSIEVTAAPLAITLSTDRAGAILR